VAKEICAKLESTEKDLRTARLDLDIQIKSSRRLQEDLNKLERQAREWVSCSLNGIVKG